MVDGFVVPAGKGIGNLPYLLENYKGSVLTLEPHLSDYDGFDRLETGEKTKMEYRESGLSRRQRRRRFPAASAFGVNIISQKKKDGFCALFGRQCAVLNCVFVGKH